MSGRPVIPNDVGADVTLVTVERLELAFAPKPWPFAVEHSGEIERNFAELQRIKPSLWNGRVLLMHEDFQIADGVFSGRYLETDYASMLTWNCRGRPPAGVRNCFGLGALRSTDGAFIVGVMAEHTANSGYIYFPCGTPDPDDIVGATVDLARSVEREVLEEVGLDSDAYLPMPGWYTMLAGQRIAQIRLLQARETAENLRRRIVDFLAREAKPEFSEIRIIRSPADFDPHMPAYVTTFLRHAWREEPLPSVAGSRELRT